MTLAWRDRIVRNKLAAIRRRLHRGELVDDRVFDSIYPTAIRAASPMHWTPIEAAMRAARLLASRGGTRIVDIGSGVGKFCVVAAASTRARVIGVEHRRGLVDVANEAATKLGVEAEFIHGTFDCIDPRLVDGVYMFNPFAENVCEPEHTIDASVELSTQRFIDDVTAAEAFLRAVPAGTRLVTYCGWGGTMPDGYERVLRERCAGTLEMWIKDV